jgi:hypothetical protein
MKGPKAQEFTHGAITDHLASPEYPLKENFCTSPKLNFCNINFPDDKTK